MVTLIKADGTTIKNFKAETLSAKQEAVGGYIELVRCPDNTFLVVNEDGIYNALELNEKASEIANMHILGDVIHLTDADIQTFLN